MSDYLTNILKRSFGLGEAIRPRLASRFEAAASAAWQEVTVAESAGPFANFRPGPLSSLSQAATSPAVSHFTSLESSLAATRDYAPVYGDGKTAPPEKVADLEAKGQSGESRAERNPAHLDKLPIQLHPQALPSQNASAVVESRLLQVVEEIQAQHPAHPQTSQPSAPSFSSSTRPETPYRPETTPETDPLSEQPVTGITSESAGRPTSRAAISVETLRAHPATTLYQEREAWPINRPTPLPAPEPVVQVTIGRIEVRAVPTPATPTRPAVQPASPGLNEYLRRSSGGR